MSLPECVIVCIKEHMVSVGEEIIMSVLEQQQQSGGDDVCCRVKFHVRYCFMNMYLFCIYLYVFKYSNELKTVDPSRIATPDFLTFIL